MQRCIALIDASDVSVVYYCECDQSSIQPVTNIIVVSNVQLQLDQRKQLGQVL